MFFDWKMLQILLQYDKVTIIEEVTVISFSLIKGTLFLKIEVDFYKTSSPGIKFSHNIVLIFRIS